MSKQCSFLKSDMTQCQAYAVDNSEFCLSHDPNQKEKKFEAVQKGGAADSYQSLKLSLPAFSIREPHDVVPAVIQTINELREGKLPPRIANTVGYLLGVALKAFEVAEIDDKIEAIDRIILERKTRK